MSIFKYFFDHDWIQRANLEQLDEQTSRISSALWSQRKENRDLAAENEALRREVSRLVLVVESINRLGLEKNLWSQDEMARKMGAVDLEDGVADGRLNPVADFVPSECSSCGKPMPRHVARCLNCNQWR
jgi:hypothetical protein